MRFFKKAIEDMAADSLRCVAIAYRLYEMENVPTSEEELAHWSLPEDALVLLAIVGLKVRNLSCVFFVFSSYLILYSFGIFFYLI